MAIHADNSRVNMGPQLLKRIMLGIHDTISTLVFFNIQIPFFVFKLCKGWKWMIR